MATAITLPTGLPFTDLENSPLFHATLNELQGNVQSFKDQTERLIKGARTYNASLDASHDAMVAFAQCVESFAGGTIAAKGEEPSAGSAFLLKFSSALKELASFQELLRAQIDVIVCEQLSHKWSRKVSEMKESRKLADRRSAEYNAARSKLVGNKDASRSAVELSTSRSLAEEARLQLASGLMAADGERSFALVEALAGVAEAHVRCCKQAAGVAERLEARRGRAEAWLGRQKEAAVARDAALAAWVEQHRDVERARDMAATGMSVQGCQNLAAQAQGSVKAPAGPAQMSVSSALMMAELETYIRATRESQGAEITILKQGYLLKQSSYFRREWRRRFFVLDSQGMFYYYSEKEKSGKDMQAKNTVNLLTSTVKPGAEDTTLPCCFRVIGATQKEYTLQAESESEQQEWIDAIQSVIMCLLHGPTSSELPQEQRPQRPTHSRSMSSSAAEVLSLFSQSLAGDPGLGPLAASLVTHSPASSAQPSPCPGRSTPQGGLSVGWSMGPGGVLPKVLLLEEMENDDESSDERDLREPALSALGASSTARHARQSTTTTTDSSFLELAGGAEAGTVADAALPALTLTSLRALPGNEACADCGAPAPSWASINLGVLLCIACSGPHRSLGVHVSKIRSLDLDVKVWDAGTLGLGCSLGNAFANGVWERGLANAPGHARPAATETDPRVRQAFIAAKYEARAFMGEPRWEARVAQRALERAVGEGDVKAAYVALAWGAEADAPAGDAVLGEPAAERLRRGLCPGAQAGGAEGTGDEGEERESVTLLHVAAGTGGALLVELLVQWGAAPDACDSKLATPLVYALACDEPLVAHFLLARGAGAQALPAPPHLGGQSPLAAAASSHLALALSQPRCRQDAALIEALRTT